MKKNFFNALNLPEVPVDYFRSAGSSGKYSPGDVEKTLLERHTMQKIKPGKDTENIKISKNRKFNKFKTI